MLTFANLKPVRLAAIAALAVATVYPAFATRATTDTAEHRLRCWQYGRLLFDQAGLSKPDASSAVVLELRKNRNQASIYLLETDNATCLITQTSTAAGD